MKMVSIIWLVFTVLFFVLGCLNWGISKQSIPPFQVSGRPFDRQVTVKIAGADVDKPLRDFADDFNSYLKQYNESSRKQNKIAAFGYFLASGTA